MQNTRTYRPTAGLQLNIYPAAKAPQRGAQSSDHELQLAKTETIGQETMAQCDENTKRSLCSAAQLADRYALPCVSEKWCVDRQRPGGGSRRRNLRNLKTRLFGTQIRWLCKCVLFVCKCVMFVFKCVLFVCKCVLFVCKCVLFVCKCVLFVFKCVLFVCKCVLFLCKCLLSVCKCALSVCKCVLFVCKCALFVCKCVTFVCKCILFVCKCVLFV
jgi:hypothetical protein